MLHAEPLRFVRDLDALDEVRLTIRCAPCPHCGRVGLVMGHGILRGYAEHSDTIVTRGRRFLCSNRFRKAGCGRTFCVTLASVIRGFTVRTVTLSRLMLALVSGHNRKVAWEQHCNPGLSLRTVYRLWQRVLDAQIPLRTALCTRAPPPSCADPRPFAQLAKHLDHLPKHTDCLLARFQCDFQRSIFQ